MSAFGGKADMPVASQMSAFDPKRTLAVEKGVRGGRCSERAPRRPDRHTAGS